jgi:hypothetical protein
MPSIEYSLFRVKMVRPHQTSFLHDDLPPRDLLLKAILDRPSGELRKGFHWHIGNVQMFGDFTGYFAAGRTTTSTIEKFDEQSSNFVEEELEESPYTHCVFDASIGFIGIAKKPNLSQTTKGIAVRLEQLLSLASVVARNDVLVEIRPIPDPDGFLIHANTIRQVDTAFSNYLKDELRDELFAILPDIWVIFDVISQIGKWNFTQAEFDRAYQDQAKRGNLSQKDVGFVLQVLFLFSVIGNARRHDYYVFRYLHRDARLSFNDRIVVHRGLFKSLQIV